MKTFQYQILRYTHDQYTGEFVNLGVIVYDPESSFLDALFTSKYGRITALFPNANGRFIIQLLKSFHTSIKLVSKQLNELIRPSHDLASITSQILPTDDSALQLTEVKYGIDPNLDYVLNAIYVDLVEKYIANDNTVQTLTDSDVWKQKYKAFFDKYNITNKLTAHEVHTKNDVFTFDKSFKNEIWHCYEPVSFDLQNEDSIKDKVYKWTGRLREIERTNQKIHITFMAQMPLMHKKLTNLIKDSLDHDTENVSIDIVLENEAEKLAQDVNTLIAAHEAHT